MPDFGYAEAVRCLAIGLLIVAGCAQARERPEPDADLTAQVEADIAKAAAQANCAVSGTHCPLPDYGEMVAEGSYNSIVRLFEAGRTCGAHGGPTVQSVGSMQARLFWKGIDGVWKDCFRRAAISLGEAERLAIQGAISP